MIGLGTMGLPMASVLLANGHRVTGFDVVPAACERHRANGGAIAPSAADAARGADAVVTMLPQAHHVRAALFGPEGIAESLAEGALVVEMSTIHPLETDAIRAQLASRGVGMVDAPVGRTSKHAREGKLLVMAGGVAEDLERARPIFDAVGEETIDCGGPGCGIRMKIVNNFMSIALNALTAEALTLAEASGLDVARAIQVLAATPAGQGHLLTTYPRKALAGDLEADFALELAHKDLLLAIDFAGKLGAASRMGPAAETRYREAMQKGRAEQDWTALYPFTRSQAGLDGDD